MVPSGLFAHHTCVLARILFFCPAPVRCVALKVKVRVVPLLTAARAVFHVWTIRELQSLALKWGSSHPHVRYGVGGSRGRSQKAWLQRRCFGLAFSVPFAL